MYGSGLLERAYFACLCHDLLAAGLRIETEKPLPLVHRGMALGCVYRADLIVEGIVLVEVKAVDAIAPVHTRQLGTYLKLADCRVGLLLNFGAPTMRQGIVRVVNGFPDR
jgi:GxxExxY protein